jgi:hypothetical protein
MHCDSEPRGEPRVPWATEGPGEHEAAAEGPVAEVVAPGRTTKGIGTRERASAVYPERWIVCPGAGRGRPSCRAQPQHEEKNPKPLQRSPPLLSRSTHDEPARPRCQTPAGGAAASSGRPARSGHGRVRRRDRVPGLRRTRRRAPPGRRRGDGPPRAVDDVGAAEGGDHRGRRRGGAPLRRARPVRGGRGSTGR